MLRIARRVLTLLSVLLVAGTSGAAPVVLRGATFHPVSGPEITDGVMVIDGGKIVALGTDVEIPASAEIVDLVDRHVYPGFVHPSSPLGLTEISSIRATNDFQEMGEINSDLRAEVAVNADSRLLPAAVTGGVLTAHVTLQGGVFTGTSAVIRLAGWNWEDMTIESSVGMFLRFPQSVKTGGGDEGNDLQAKALEVVNDTLENARIYQTMRQAGARVDADAKLEALLPVLSGELPLYVEAREKTQIVDALDWAAEQGITRLVLVTGADAQHVAERLAKDDVPVILDRVQALPTRRWNHYDEPFVAAKKLHDAGVRFCIGDGGDAANARNLPFQAATAAAFGLPQDVALRSVTLSAAEILGVDAHVGSLDPGKEASFIVTTGDPLEILTRIERVWIRGEEIDLGEDPQRRLYEKYRGRPKTTVTRQGGR